MNDDAQQLCAEFGHHYVPATIGGPLAATHVARKCRHCDRLDLRRGNETWRNGADDYGYGTDGD